MSLRSATARTRFPVAAPTSRGRVAQVCGDVAAPAPGFTRTARVRRGATVPGSGACRVSTTVVAGRTAGGRTVKAGTDNGWDSAASHVAVSPLSTAVAQYGAYGRPADGGPSVDRRGGQRGLGREFGGEGPRTEESSTVPRRARGMPASGSNPLASRPRLREPGLAAKDPSDAGR